MKRKFQDCCSICLEDIEDHNLVMLECSHELHEKCYNKLIESTNQVCPVCRTEIDVTDFFEMMCKKISDIDIAIQEHHKKVVKSVDKLKKISNALEILLEPTFEGLCSSELKVKLTNELEKIKQQSKAHKLYEQNLIKERIEYKKTIKEMCKDEELHEWVSIEATENMSDLCETESGVFIICKYCDAFANSYTDEMYYDIFIMYGPH